MSDNVKLCVLSLFDYFADFLCDIICLLFDQLYAKGSWLVLQIEEVLIYTRVSLCVLFNFLRVLKQAVGNRLKLLVKAFVPDDIEKDDFFNCRFWIVTFSRVINILSSIGVRIY